MKKIILHVVNIVLLNSFFVFQVKIKMITIKKIFFYAFALFNLISLIYSMGYDYMTGAEIHYDFYGAFFVCWLIFFGILKAILNI